MKTKTEEQIEEFWDEYSETIGTDIDDLNYYSGKTIMNKDGFFTTMRKFAKGFEQGKDEKKSLRSELIKYTRQFYADEETCIHNIDEYLKIQSKETKQ